MTARTLKHSLHVIAFLSCCLFLFLMAACSSSAQRFKLEGHFKNLNQGEFYLYNYDEGTIDTIAVNDGRFVYDISTRDTTTLVFLFPNYSEIPIFAQPGASLTMKGDASHLRETDIKGTEANELMTAFRLKTNDMTPPQVEQEAATFIGLHPNSPVSCYLLRRYIIQSATPDYQLACQLCEQIQQAQPNNVELARLLTQLQTLRNALSTGQLPQFTAITLKGDTIDTEHLLGKPTVIIAWASWNYDSYAVFRRLQPLHNAHRSQMAVVAISLDASSADCQRIISRDSITWPCVCDQLMWQSPIIDSLGISTLPTNILTDRQGNIVARNLSDNELIEKLEAMLP